MSIVRFRIFDLRTARAGYALYGRLKGKRFSIYVPNDLAPEVSTVIANGQHVQELLSEAAVRYTQALKESRKQEKSQ